MSMYGKFDGIIGGKSLRPTKTPQRKRRSDGTMKEVAFMRFTMFCEDMTKRPVLDEVTGKMRRPRKQVQVILPENERGSKLFEHLSPGRRIRVEGRITNDPKESNGVIYANEKCYMDDLTFLDSPREKQITRALSDMVSAGLIDEDKKEEYDIYMQNFYSERNGGENVPRIYHNNLSTDSGYRTNQNDATNPDQTDFA